MKVITLSLTSASVICAPVCGSLAASMAPSMSRGASGSAARLRRRSAMAALSASWKAFAVDRTPSRVSRGTKSGRPMTSNGSMPLLVAKYRVVAARIASGSPSPSEKMQPISASSATRLISVLISQTLPSGRLCKRSTRAAATRVIAGANPAVIFRPNIGASRRRNLCQCSPSTVTSPLGMRAARTRRSRGLLQ